MSVQTANWFAANTEQSDDGDTRQYTLLAPFSMDPERAPSLCVVDAVATVAGPSSGQTTLALYEYLEPDALNDLVERSGTKRSQVEVRFTVEEYLVVVRSPDTILVYEPA